MYRRSVVCLKDSKVATTPRDKLLVQELVILKRESFMDQQTCCHQGGDALKGYRIDWFGGPQYVVDSVEEDETQNPWSMYRVKIIGKLVGT